jgi:hypothetical protein
MTEVRRQAYELGFRMTGLGFSLSLIGNEPDMAKLLHEVRACYGIPDLL